MLKFTFTFRDTDGDRWQWYTHASGLPTAWHYARQQAYLSGFQRHGIDSVARLAEETEADGPTTYTATDTDYAVTVTLDSIE